MTTFTCLNCETPFTRPPTRGQRPRWCPDCAPLHLRWKPCVGCGELAAIQASLRFCSAECSASFPREKTGPKGSWRSERWQAAKVRARTARRGHGGFGHPLYVDQAGGVTHHRPWASAPCRVSASVRAAIYERDGWVCQLCSDAVDPDLEPHDIWAATLDHIVCRSWTEEPDDSPENLRLAHRWCNSVRGDETYYPGEVLAA